MARRFYTRIRVGVAGWSYDDWHGILYPEPEPRDFDNIDQPLFSRSIKPSARATGCVGYVRVHGRNYRDWFRNGAGRDARYDYLYRPGELQRWAERAKEVARDEQVDTVDVVFNNHYKAQAVVNALEFRKILGDPHVEAPPTLLDAYPDALGAVGISAAA